MKLKDQVAIVTGAGRNIGEEIAKLFAAEGAKVAVVDLDEPRGARVAAAIKDKGGEAELFVADLTDKAGLSLPITGAIKELVKDARRIKATNAPKWTGRRDGHDKSIAETPPSTNRLAP